VIDDVFGLRVTKIVESEDAAHAAAELAPAAERQRRSRA
jgi:hypothetical protein